MPTRHTKEKSVAFKIFSSLSYFCTLYLYVDSHHTVFIPMTTIPIFYLDGSLGGIDVGVGGFVDGMFQNTLHGVIYRIQVAASEGQEVHYPEINKALQNFVIGIYEHCYGSTHRCS